MDRREDALLQALQTNASETERWEAFKRDNESTVRNLDKFAQNLSVEVMVPIGRKALMPGELIHTNELLVGHYEGYFSACSAHKAKEICQYRLKLAEEQLKKLAVENDLWQKKLYTPFAEGAVPSGDQVEIVEDFNEESHNKWLAEHRKRMRQQKQKERLEREVEPAEKDNEVLRKLEEREMMEELGLDPDNIDEGQLHDMLSQEPQKSNNESSLKSLTQEEEDELWKKLEAEEQNEAAELSSEAEESLKTTDKLVRQLMSGETETPSSKKRTAGTKKNVEIQEAISEDDDDDDDGDQEEEVRTIREQMALLPNEDREPFLRAQLYVLKAKMRKIQKVNFISDELIHLMNVVVMLEDDLQDLIFEQELEASEEEEVVVENSHLPEEPNEELLTAPEASTNKRRISFALDDEKLEFRREETVAEMLPNAKKNSRDIIKLNAPVKPAGDPQPVSIKTKRQSNQDILQKVERNIEFVKENQSVQDFDLLNRIMEESTGLINTLHISFTHSGAIPSPSSDQSDGIPGKPSDFYDKYEKDRARLNDSFPIYVNGFEGEEQVKVPILSEAARGSAYEDPRSQFSKPNSSDISCTHSGAIPSPSSDQSRDIPGNPSDCYEKYEKDRAQFSKPDSSTDPESAIKSILRNKSAVDLEPHNVNQQPKKGKKGRKQKKKERTLDDDLRDMSAYQKVMHDLVEKEPTAPEPLPPGKFIDSHAPKKRVSRFKEQRALNKT
ncbi:unconventional prefoldin RPB5 interactor-like protein [Drosophila mauritiana]|uniref:Unconventional prefoldin RPB5 interactor-like protein n=1 Tax=Drosophila mauritiana TaxID=7226 RepID=A0A6P8JJM9_DROMA|nr:unconventional prefoldin RPB5 interactor-like protein [Drosophila mauritiana]